jgi:hypothetical protein
MEPRHFWVLLRAHTRMQATATGEPKGLAPQDVDQIQAWMSGAQGPWA